MWRPKVTLTSQIHWEDSSPRVASLAPPHSSSHGPFFGKQERSCWCCRFLSALLQFRQLWKRISRIPCGRRREWWDYFGLSLRRAAPTSMPGLGRATWGQTGGQLQEMAGHLGLVPGAITALLLDSRHSHKPDHLENYNKTCIDTRKKGLNTGDKGQKPSQASREASFYRAAAVPSLPLQLSYIDVPQRCWSPSH